MGSGSLEVLGTPRLLAWSEAACCAVLVGRLAEADTSVGSRVSVEHLRASRVGAALTVTATLRQVDGRLLRFDVAVTHDDLLVASVDATRVVVDRQRFLARS